MSNLLDFVIDRHGGIGRWRRASTVSAAVHVRGRFWELKGQADRFGAATVVADVHRQRIRRWPFGSGAELEFDAEADRVRIASREGDVEQIAARSTMVGHPRETPWSPTQAGYFISYATWTYLLEPYLFTLPGVETREIEPWHEVGETWRRLEVTFPDSIATHSSVQVYYFDADTGLQRRMDYSPDVTGRPLVAHYTTEHRDFGGLIVPTRRRVLHRDDAGVANQGAAGILLDLDQVQLLA